MASQTFHKFRAHQSSQPPDLVIGDTCVVTTWRLGGSAEIVKSILHQIVIIIHSHCHYHHDDHSQPEQSGNSGLKNSSRSYSMLNSDELHSILDSHWLVPGSPSLLLVHGSGETLG